jgi:hypothetical protein
MRPIVLRHGIPDCLLQVLTIGIVVCNRQGIRCGQASGHHRLGAVIGLLDDVAMLAGDGVHLRLMVTRGVKRTPSQDPRRNGAMFCSGIHGSKPLDDAIPDG